jgi:hypothetical protein
MQLRNSNRGILPGSVGTAKSRCGDLGCLAICDVRLICTFMKALYGPYAGWALIYTFVDM